MSRGDWRDRESTADARQSVARATIVRSVRETTPPKTNDLKQRVGNQAIQRMMASKSTRVAQREPADKKDAKKDKPAPAEAQSPRTQVYVVRDENLRLGGTLVSDLNDLKKKLISSKLTSGWTLVLSIHGSEELLGAQSPPDWQKNAIFYKAADIEKLFNGDKDFVKWRDQYGPNQLSMVSCQISAAFEGTLISNLTRAGAGNKRQAARGLGEGCKPIATALSLTEVPATHADFDKLPKGKRDAIRTKLQKLNEEWGYYGAAPVPDDQVMDYYYDEDPKGAWIKVEVMVGKGHSLDELVKTGIPFWNRTTGDKSAKFREKCDQGAAKLREHESRVPDVPE